METSPRFIHSTLLLRPWSNGECGLELRLENRGSAALELDYLEPLLPSEIQVLGQHGEIPVTQPAANLISRPMSRAVAPGETVDLPLALRLRFDAAASPAGGADPLCWTLRHQAGPVLVRLQVPLFAGALLPVEAQWEAS